MAVEKRKTTDHEEIRAWVEQHNGHPASLQPTAGGGPDLLRIDFPGHVDEEPLHRIDWAEWFEQFERHGRAFLYQTEMAPEEDITFFKLVER